MPPTSSNGPPHDLAILVISLMQNEGFGASRGSVGGIRTPYVGPLSREVSSFVVCQNGTSAVQVSLEDFSLRS